MTESATGMMPAVMGDEAPGAQDPFIGPRSCCAAVMRPSLLPL
eukprot:COSAG02_NODE_48719_length_332_cov_0.248927_1_plen_42_part_01